MQYFEFVFLIQRNRHQRKVNPMVWKNDGPTVYNQKHVIQNIGQPKKIQHGE